MRRAVFLDRDDTLIHNRSLTPAESSQHPGDLADPARVQLINGASAACSALRHAGFTLIVVSNQGIVARSGATLDMVDATNRALMRLLPRPDGSGPMIEAVYFCPFHPEGSHPDFAREHPWRKPAPGMFLAAAEDFDIDLASSWSIGDAPRDTEAAIAAGIPPSQALLLGNELPNLEVAARFILSHSGTDPVRDNPR